MSRWLPGAFALVVALTATASADDRGPRDDRGRDDDGERDRDDRGPSADSDGVLVVNGADARAGAANASELVKLRKRLEALGVLQPASQAIVAALEGEPPYDLDPIRNAYANFEFERADELIDSALSDLTTDGNPETMAEGAAELFYWKGLVAAVDDRTDEAVAWFAAVYRIEPDHEIDKATTPPKVRTLIEERAQQLEPRLRDVVFELTGDGTDAELVIDGGAPRAIPESMPMAQGYHLIVVTAPRRKPFGAIVEVRSRGTNSIPIDLGPEDDVARARRLRLETLDADSAEARLKRARRLAKITGARKFLVIEGERDDRDALTVRVYDAVDDTESPPLALREATRPSVLAKLLGVDSGALGSDGPPAWYKRWYVWAAVGAVAVGAGTGIYLYSQREPSRITF